MRINWNNYNLINKVNTVFNRSKIIVKFEKLDSEFCEAAFQKIQDLINYQKEKGRKFISFQKSFWENYKHWNKIHLMKFFCVL